MLLILTAVDKVYINYNKENQQGLSKLTINEAKKYIDNGEFAKGSMLPKVEACIDFVSKSPNKVALITSLDEANNAISGNNGTLIVNE